MDEDIPLRNEDGFMESVDAGDAGLLIFQVTDKTPYAGYTNKEASEKNVLRDVFEKGDAWINTGDFLKDIGFKHAQFVDRLGDTYRWKSENVSTLEVEKAINQFQNITQSTVYGVSVPHTEGRAGMAAVILDCDVDQFDLKMFSDFLRQNLPPYAVPLFVRFEKEFDVTGSMKIIKKRLKEEAFDPDKINEPLYVMQSKNAPYVPLTKDMYQEIIEGTYKF